MAEFDPTSERTTEPADTRDKLLADLARTRAFAHLPRPKLERLIHAAPTQVFPKGGIILQEGHDNVRIFFLLRGSVSVYSGGMLVSRYGRAGDIFGEMSVVSDAPTSATVIANEEVEVLVLDGTLVGDFRSESDSDLAIVYYKLFAYSLLEKLRLTTLKARLAEDAIRRMPPFGAAPPGPESEAGRETVAKHLSDILLVSQAVHTADRAIVVTDAEGRIMRINLAAESLLDCIEIQVAGKPIHELCPEGSGDAQIFKLIQEQISSWHGDMEVCKFRGEPFPAKVALSAVLDGEGRRVGVLAVIDDRSEQVALQRRLEHAHKLELAGRMAGSIAHDLNNLLQPIIGYTHLALEHAPEDARLQRYLQTVVKASGRATDLVAQFLLFSGRPRIAVMRLAVPPLLDECARTIRGKLPAAITIRQELAADLPALLGDGTQIQRILLNLAVNAGHAMPKGGTLTLAADAEVLDGLADCFGARLSGPFVRLSVTDTGVGMDAETLEQIWDPFFTTRGAGEGLGLGLAMLRSIVELHKGGVEVCSTPGVGTTFAIHLPATAHGAQPETPVVAAVAGSGTILFVDDEEMVCSLAKAVLERVGYVVRTERQSPEALALFQANPARWDLVITDLAMPNLRGDALARQMREARPDIPIILCTGNLHAGGAGQEPPLEFSDILFKPAEPSQLCLQVRRTLERVRLGA